jgi:arylsulfatase/uncharacterized sulfatase
MRVPMIVAGPGVQGVGDVNHAFSFVTDIAPTLLTLAGLTAPEGRYGGRPVAPMIGRDLTPLLRGEVERAYQPDDTIGYELAGHAALFQGDYKILYTRGPLGDGQWHLYDIVRDPGETIDLAAKKPAQMQNMLSAYQRYVQENGVLALPKGYDSNEQVLTNLMHKRFKDPVLIALLTVLILLPFLVAWRVGKKA